jgi:hypothetical protein
MSAALSFPLLLGISGLHVNVQDPALLHGAKPRNLTRPVNYNMCARIRHWLRAVGVDAVVSSVLGNHPLGGTDSLDARIADLSDGLIHPDGASFGERSQ